ncbi:ATP-binding protein [Mesorhizobium sp. M0563]|uniref:ATP-binding protein n=1 Tax=Mesorhizobium sp. M0563 TaxID=2956959 RepID=UPI00333CADA8
MATEGEWLDSIAAAASCERQGVEDVLRQHGIKAQSSVPRARQVSFTSVSFAGVKEETDADGPFSFDWSNLGQGLWAVMSDLNLRGKSSVMNILQAALRGDFPSDIKPDVWRWLSRVTVGLMMDSVHYRVSVEKLSGGEDPDGAKAALSRLNRDEWVPLYEGGIAGLKGHVEALFMEELGFSRLQAVNEAGTRYEHSWPAVAACLSIGGNAESKALFGEIIYDALPQRLLQLFIGMPWISTLTAISAAKKVMTSSTPRGFSDPFAPLKARIKTADQELAAARKETPAAAGRTDVRKRMATLDAELVAKQETLSADRSKLQELEERYERTRTEKLAQARLVQELRDEKDAGYVFRNLRPERCPACEADFHDHYVHADDGNCPLCKTTIVLEDGAADDRLTEADNNLKDITTALQIVAAEWKAARRSVKDSEKARDAVASELSVVQGQFRDRRDDVELRIAELEATIRELKALVGEEPQSQDAGGGLDKAILDAAEKKTKAIIEDFQNEVLADVSKAVMRLSTRFGVGNLTDAKLNGAGHLKLIQGGAETSFSKLTKGERLRVKIAAALAAVEVARERGLGRHPGLLLLDSPRAEEVVDTDFLEMLKSVSKVATEMGGVQVIMGTIHRPDLDDVVPGSHRRHAVGSAYLF